MALLDERGRALEAGAPVTGLAWTGDASAFALGDGTIRFIGAEDERVIEVHQGACLSLAVEADGLSVVTGGDDGRLVRTSSATGSNIITDLKGKWIEHVAAGPSGALAFSSARHAFSQSGKVERSFEAPSSIGGLAFAPRGLRLAVAHYGGVSLYWISAESTEATLLPWKGSHQIVTWSPDGRFVLTTMQENALHGWRLADKQDMRMAGYPSKIRNLSWSPKGRWLATCGAEAIVLWPFQGKDGPLGKSAKELGARPQISTAVACHPTLDIVAAGYRDGLLLLVRIEDSAEIVAANPGGGAVTAIAWHPSGGQLAFGTENGRIGVIPV